MKKETVQNKIILLDTRYLNSIIKTIVSIKMQLVQLEKMLKQMKGGK
jgi:hypothetical protein